MIARSGAVTSIATDTSGAAEVTITPIPAAPSCAGYDLNTLPGGSTISAVLLCTMPMGLPVTYAIVRPPANGTLGPINQGTGIVSYTPARGFSGTDGFTFNAHNDGGASATAAVTITVPPLPAPSARCVVPRLKGKSLKAAASLLSAAGCALGKVTRPKPRKHRKVTKNLVVVAQSAAPGTQLRAGSKVALTLGQVAGGKRRHGHR
jgi:hypothetical protein